MKRSLDYSDIEEFIKNCKASALGPTKYLKSHKPPCSERTFWFHWKKCKDMNVEDINLIQIPVGRPPQFSENTKLKLKEIIVNLQAEFGAINKDMIYREDMDIAATKQEGEMNYEKAMTRVQNIGSTWWKKIKSDLQLTFKKTSHPIELSRALKSQPEITAEYMRILFHTQALCHIQRKLCSGASIQGWVLDDGLVSRVENGIITHDHQPIADKPILKVENDKIILVPLNEPLEFVHPDLRLNADEKPILPDSPVCSSWNMKDLPNQPNTCGRSASWTLHWYLRASGHILPPLVILRGQSVECSVVQKFHPDIACVTATINGYQDNDTFYNDLVRILPLIGSSVNNPAILDTDGHITRLQPRVIQLLCKYSVYLVISPSHSSTIHQALDNGPNSCFQSEYEKLYTAKGNAIKTILTKEEKVDLILQTIGLMKNEPVKFQNCWRAIGQPDGMIQPERINIQKYNIGKMYRDSTLPKVTVSLLSKLFSKEELVKAPRSGFNVDKNIISNAVSGGKVANREIQSQQHLAQQLVEIVNSRSATPTLHQYRLNLKKSSNGKVVSMYTKYEFYQQSALDRIQLAIGEERTVEDEIVPEYNEEGEVYTGRISTSGGTLLSLKKNLDEMIEKHEKKKKQQQQKELNKKKKEEDIKNEAPITNLLKSLNWISKERQQARAVDLKDFLQAHGEKGLSRLKRDQMIALLFKLISINKQWQPKPTEN